MYVYIILFGMTSHHHVCIEAKSQTIRRMQSNLETWDKQLEEIFHKKAHNGMYEHMCFSLQSLCGICVIYRPYMILGWSPDTVARSEIDKREKKFEELTEIYNTECERRRATEQERDTLTDNLVCLHNTTIIYMYSTQS